MNIIEDFEHWREQRHHPIPAIQENPMTQPQQQPIGLVDSLHGLTSELAGNPLIKRLADHRLGMLLTPGEADHITALIVSLEQGRGPRYAQQPDAPHDGTQPVQQ